MKTILLSFKEKTTDLIFEWDEYKNQINEKKHGITFEGASLIFRDPFLISILDDRFYYEEERWQSIGSVQNITIFVAHTFGENDNGEEIIRIITARAATPSEAKRYFSNRQT